MKITHPDLDQTNEPESRKENHLIELMIETHQLAQTNSQFLLRRMVIACIPVLILISLPFYLFPSTKFWFGLLLLPLAALIGWRLRRKILPLTPLNFSIFILALMILISTWTTYDLSISLPKISSAVIGIGIFFVTTEFAASQEGWIGGILLLVLFGVGMSLLSYMGMSWPEEKFMKFPLFSSLIERFPQLISGLTQGTEGLIRMRLRVPFSG